MNGNNATGRKVTNRATPASSGKDGRSADLKERKGLEAKQEEMAAFAKEAGLHYISYEDFGITRRKKGRAFAYLHADGKRVKDKPTVERIRKLAIPPAYQDVWICQDPQGHLQATGRDARGRKQYRYHARWREVRDANKFDRMMAFGRMLPKIRSITHHHLKLRGLSREKVLGTVVQLLEKTLIRVGNEEYARSNDSYGLSTLRDKHVEIKGSRIRFEFRGKSKVYHEIDIDDRRLAKIVRDCQEIPGYDLFQYFDDAGERHSITSSDVNDYLREITGAEVTAKDFRTWAGTVLAAMALAEVGEFSSKTQAARNINAAIESVSKRLGNTRSVCRKCYVHPQILQAYLDGEVVRIATRLGAQELKRSSSSLDPHEKAVLRLLENRLRKSSRRPG